MPDKNPAAVALGSIKSTRKAEAARENGKRGGRMSYAEKQFVAKYPHGRAVMTTNKPYEMFTVYAGEYPCAEGHTRAEAFRRALEYAEQGLITPDPEEAAQP